ncbi:MAG: hypothetical protein ABEI13_01075, partial [Candidatus Paceibacteria bacterium]
DDLLSDMQEYVDLVDKMATTDSFSESDYYDLQVLNDEISETELGDVISSVGERFETDINDTIDNMGSVSILGGLLTFPMKKCSICGSDIQKETYTRDMPRIDFVLLRCEECKSEWASDGFRYNITNNPEGIENISLAPSVWNKIRSSNQNIGENPQQYKNKSAKVIRYKKYSTVITFLLFIFLLLNYSFEPHIILLIITPLFGLMQILFAGVLQKVVVYL